MSFSGTPSRRDSPQEKILIARGAPVPAEWPYEKGGLPRLRPCIHNNSLLAPQVQVDKYRKDQPGMKKESSEAGGVLLVIAQITEESCEILPLHPTGAPE